MDTNEKRTPEGNVAAAPKNESGAPVARSPKLVSNSRPFVFIRGFFYMVPAKACGLMLSPAAEL
jgi:hypothetical protein